MYVFYLYIIYIYMYVCIIYMYTRYNYIYIYIYICFIFIKIFCSPELGLIWAHKTSTLVFWSLRSLSFGSVLSGTAWILADTPIEEFTPTPAFPALQYLESVDEGGVAWKAGLRTGDFLIEVRTRLGFHKLTVCFGKPQKPLLAEGMERSLISWKEWCLTHAGDFILSLLLNHSHVSANRKMFMHSLSLWIWGKVMVTSLMRQRSLETQEMSTPGKSCECTEVRPDQKLSFLMSLELFGLGCI